MPFTIICGTFHVLHSAPDGDSIHFRPLNTALLKKLDGPPAMLSASQQVNLRLEMIDAPELHYTPEGGHYPLHQPIGFAQAARDLLLMELGIHDVRWDSQGTIVHAHDGTAGFILSRATDKYHRPIVFAFAGSPPAQDGAHFHMSPKFLRNSVNYKLAEAGLVYPTFYKGLFADLRVELTETVIHARKRAQGIWPHDCTNAGATVLDLTNIQEKELILPKLFRRLAEYIQGGGTLDGFTEFLEARAENIFIISQRHFTHLDTVVRVSGNTLTLTVPPEDLVFIDT